MEAGENTHVARAAKVADIRLVPAQRAQHTATGWHKVRDTEQQGGLKTLL